jgi:hypothetical protein
VKKFGARFAFFEVRGDAIANDSASAIFRVRTQGFFVGTRIVHAAVSNLPPRHQPLQKIVYAPIVHLSWESVPSIFDHNIRRPF